MPIDSVLPSNEAGQDGTLLVLFVTIASEEHPTQCQCAFFTILFKKWMNACVVPKNYELIDINKGAPCVLSACFV
jgi:hypothetical protein